LPYFQVSRGNFGDWKIAIQVLESRNLDFNYFSPKNMKKISHEPILPFFQPEKHILIGQKLKIQPNKKNKN
jgi:hypothetical protein